MSLVFLTLQKYTGVLTATLLLQQSWNSFCPAPQPPSLVLPYFTFFIFFLLFHFQEKTHWKGWIFPQGFRRTLLLFFVMEVACVFPVKNRSFFLALLGLGYLFSLLFQSRLPFPSNPVLFFLFLGSCFGGAYGSLSLIRFYQLKGSRVDLGTFVAIFESFFPGGVAPFTAFGESQFALHFSPSLLTLFPFYVLCPRPETLLLLGVGLHLAAVYPLYRYAQERLKDSVWPLLLGGMYLLYPLHSNVLLFDFHEISLFPLFFFAFLYAHEEGKYKRAFLFWILSLGVQETLCLPLMFFALGGGAGITGESKKRSVFVFYFLVAFLWFCFTFLYWMPHYGFALKGRYEGLGQGPLDVLFHLIWSPHLWMQRLFTLEKFMLSLFLGVPLVFLPFLTLRSLFFCFPALMVHVLSSLPDQAFLRWHYGAFVLPFLLYSSLESFVVFQTNRRCYHFFLRLFLALNRSSLWGAEKNRLGLAVLGVSLSAHFLFCIPFSPPYFKDLPALNYRPSHQLYWFSCSLNPKDYQISEAWTILQELKQKIPKTVSLGVQNNLGSCFGEYPQAYGIHRLDCEYYLIHLDLYDYYEGKALEALIKRFETEPFWQPIYYNYYGFDLMRQVRPQKK